MFSAFELKKVDKAVGSFRLLWVKPPAQISTKAANIGRGAYLKPEVRSLASSYYNDDRHGHELSLSNPY